MLQMKEATVRGVGGNTALHYAACRGSVESFQIL
jgi:hypothetical protein